MINLFNIHCLQITILNIDKIKVIKILKLTFIILIETCLISCKEKTPTIDGYYVIKQIEANLDKNSKKELIVVYDPVHVSSSFHEVPRLLNIYKKEKGKWTLFKHSSQAIFGKIDGGAFGDPLISIEVKNKILKISQLFGCSSAKRYKIDSYKLNSNEMLLIKNYSFIESVCDFNLEYQCDFITGKFILSKDYFNCQIDSEIPFKHLNEEFDYNGLHITIEKRNEKDIIIISPKGIELYLAVDKDRLI